MTRKKWMKFKKDLPGNWCQQISKALAAKGLPLTERQISEVRAAKIINLGWQTMVWKEINDLQKKFINDQQSLQKLKSGT